MCYFAPATSRTGLSHRIGYVLGGYYRVPHSLTSCFTLAPVLDSYSTLEPDKLTAISSALGGGLAQGCSSAELMAGLVFQLGLPHRLRDAGVTADEIPRIGMLVRHHFPQDCVRMDFLGPDALDQLILSLW